MWGNQSKNHQPNPFTTKTFEIKGLDNLNPFSKKKKKKEKFSIGFVDQTNKKKTTSTTKKKAPNKKSSSHKNPKSAQKKPTTSHSKSHRKPPRTSSNRSRSRSSISNEHCINPHQVNHNTASHDTDQSQTSNVSHSPPTNAHRTQPNSNATKHNTTTSRAHKTASKPQPVSRTTRATKPSTTANHRTVSKPQSSVSRPPANVTSSNKSRPKRKVQSVKKEKKPISKKRRERRYSEDDDDASERNSKKHTKKRTAKKKKSEENDNEAKSDEEPSKGKKKGGKGKKDQDSEFRSRLEADIIDEKPDISFRDVQGLESVKLALYETIILPNLRPELFTGLRAPSSGLLLFGPPGNGKTMIAKCVAAECDGTFFSISASSITSKWVGDAERIMRTLFNLARDRAPSIIFIDEIDSLLTARGGSNEAESSRRVKTEFLIQFDGVKKASEAEKRVLVIGATNLPDQLDEAVLRRFGKRIMVPLPDKDTRRGLLTLLMAKQKTNLSPTDFDQVVTKSEGYSCSDLSTLCKDASMGPIRDLGAKIIEIQSVEDMPSIEVKHFNAALDNVKPSLPQSSLNYFNEWNDKFGSKIHLSMSALPENMKPYTDAELLLMSQKAASNQPDEDIDVDQTNDELDE